MSFRYEDADGFAAEFSELYAYSELDEFNHNAQAFRDYCDRKKVPTYYPV